MYFSLALNSLCSWSFCFQLPSAGITGMHFQIIWCWDLTQGCIFLHAKQAFHQWSHIPKLWALLLAQLKGHISPWRTATQKCKKVHVPGDGPPQGQVGVSRLCPNSLHFHGEPRGCLHDSTGHHWGGTSLMNPFPHFPFCNSLSLSLLLPGIHTQMCRPHCLVWVLP